MPREGQDWKVEKDISYWTFTKAGLLTAFLVQMTETQTTVIQCLPTALNHHRESENERTVQNVCKLHHLLYFPTPIHSSVSHKSPLIDSRVTQI